MSSIETTLKRQLGVKPHVNMDENVVWFVWDKDEPLVPSAVFKAITDGGMGLNSFKIIGHFKFEGGHATSNKGLDFDYTGEAHEAGKWTVEISGYEEKGRCKIHAVMPYFEPKVFNTEQ